MQEKIRDALISRDRDERGLADRAGTGVGRLPLLGPFRDVRPRIGECGIVEPHVAREVLEL